MAHSEMDNFFHDVNALKRINILKNDSLLAISSQSGMFFGS